MEYRSKNGIDMRVDFDFDKTLEHGVFHRMLGVTPYKTEHDAINKIDSIIDSHKRSLKLSIDNEIGKIKKEIDNLRSEVSNAKNDLPWASKFEGRCNRTIMALNNYLAEFKELVDKMEKGS